MGRVYRPRAPLGRNRAPAHAGSRGALAARRTLSPVNADEANRSEPLPAVELYTDGACSGNPGPGGWAYLLKHPATGRSREASGGEPATTNNKMELTAVIEGLRALTRPSHVELYSDSKYVLDGLKSWIHSWKKKGWKTASKQPVKNAELWKELDALRNQHDVHFNWVKGHAGHPENERVDELAVAARDAQRG
jgi:ribonuclease HI